MLKWWKLKTNKEAVACVGLSTSVERILILSATMSHPVADRQHCDDIDWLHLYDIYEHKMFSYIILYQ